VRELASQDHEPDELGEPHELRDHDELVEPDPRRLPLSTGERRWLVGLVVFGAVIRIAWLAWTKSEPPQAWYRQGDQYSYYYYGREIALGRGYISYATGQATAYYPIGYPALLAGLYFLALHTPITDDLMVVTGVLHIVMGVATIYLTFVVGRRMMGVKAGLVAAGIVAFWPNLIYQVSSVQVETAFLFFAMAALAVIVDHDWSSGLPSRARLLAFGAVLAVSALVRPFSVWLLVGLAAAAAITAGGGRAGWRAAAWAVAWPALVLVIAFAPWTIRNAVRLDSFVPSSTNMGDTLCIDRSLDARGGYRWALHEGCADPALPEAERNRKSTALALEFVRDHPGRELLQIWRRSGFMFATDHDGLEAVDTLGREPRFAPDEKRLLQRLANGYYFAMLWLAVPGVVLAAIRSTRPIRWLVGSLFLALLVVPLLLYGNARFHVPLTCFGAIGAAATITSLATLVAGSTLRRPGTAATGSAIPAD